MMGVPTPEFGTKTYYLAIFLLKTSFNEKNWTERGHTLLVPPWINQCISTSNDTSIVKSGEQKLNGKLISKSEDDEFYGLSIRILVVKGYQYILQNLKHYSLDY